VEIPVTIEGEIPEKVRTLPPEKQSELLEMANSLSSESQAKAPLISPKGLWAGLDIDLPADDFDELRREIWKNFPREL